MSPPLLEIPNRTFLHAWASYPDSAPEAPGRIIANKRLDAALAYARRMQVELDAAARTSRRRSARDRIRERVRSEASHNVN